MYSLGGAKREIYVVCIYSFCSLLAEPNRPFHWEDKVKKYVLQYSAVDRQTRTEQVALCEQKVKYERVLNKQCWVAKYVY